MKQEELSRKITELINETKDGKLKWSLEVQTTEGNEPDEKPVETEDGIAWTLDECYAAYHCKGRDKEFCMITYELIKTAGDKVQTSNLVFLPPLSVRYFDLHTLLPYAVEMGPVLASQIHQLWELLMKLHKAGSDSVSLQVRPGTLTIEDE